MTARELNDAILGAWFGSAQLEITPDMLTVTLPPLPLTPTPRVYHWAYRIRKWRGRFQVELGAVGHNDQVEPLTIRLADGVLYWGDARYKRVQK